MVHPSIMKSHKHSKMIETDFYKFIFHSDRSKNIASSPQRVRHPFFLIAVSVWSPNFGQIGLGMAYLCIFVEEVVALLGAIADNWV